MTESDIDIIQRTSLVKNTKDNKTINQKTKDSLQLNETMEKYDRSDFDNPWKRILDIYFEDFVAFCWPSKYNEIDWSKGYKTLDKELTKLTNKIFNKNRYADKLIEVYLISGKKTIILVHIEIQATYQKILSERMFIYKNRIFEKYRLPIASIAILIFQSKLEARFL